MNADIKDIEDAAAVWRNYLANRPFGDVDLAKAKLHRTSSEAYKEAASNLFDKAWDAWEEDRPRALKYLALASRLPYDEWESGFPAAVDAQMRLFNMVADALEGSDPGDHAWLDIVESALDESDEQGRLTLACVLRIIADDYDLEQREQGRVRAILAEIPEVTPIRERADVTADELRDHLVGVLGTSMALEAAYQALDD